MKYRKLIAIALLALLTSACAQQAVFTSTPSGARVIVDGAQIGVTPCAYDYRLSSSGNHEVVITKEGYEPVDFVVAADEVDTSARNRWLAAGVVWSPLWIGTLFTKKLKDAYDFALRTDQKMTASATMEKERNGL